MDKKGVALCLWLLGVALSQDIDVELLHDLEHQSQTVHEGVDGHSQHPICRRAVVYLQDLRLVVGAGADG